jgi:hypothetical protein
MVVHRILHRARPIALLNLATILQQAKPVHGQYLHSLLRLLWKCGVVVAAAVQVQKLRAAGKIPEQVLALI